MSMSQVRDIRSEYILLHDRVCALVNSGDTIPAYFSFIELCKEIIKLCDQYLNKEVVLKFYLNHLELFTIDVENCTVLIYYQKHYIRFEE